jgi:hypothetical protein
VEGDWSAQQLNKMTKAILYYERCVDTLMPPRRRNNKYCLSNRRNPKLKDKSTQDIFDEIDNITKRTDLLRDQWIRQIMSLMCCMSFIPLAALEDLKKAGEQTIPLVTYVERNMRWNFEPLAEGVKGTIEFRQPPGSNSYADAHFWTTFTRAYVYGAMHAKIDASKEPTLESFQAFLINGAQVAGMDTKDIDLLKARFDGLELLPPP